MDMTLDLYVDYLICSTSHVTATGLSKMVNGSISHDKVTRFLNKKAFMAIDLWKMVKPHYKTIESEDGAIVIDDSIEKKPYTDENDIISWHYDHTKNMAVKGINFLTAFYTTEKGNAVVGYEITKKDQEVENKKTGKKKRIASISKHEQYRNLLVNAVKNEIKFKYVISDSWFSSTKNMNFIKKELNKDFIMPLKANRKVTLIDANNQTSNQPVRIDSLELGESALVSVQGLDFPLRIVRQVFKDGDVVTGVLYLATSDIGLTAEEIATNYKKRWKVEVYHESLKCNASLEKSPTKTVRSQLNHFFASLCAYMRLESLSRGAKTNHFALKNKIYMVALKSAFAELRQISSTVTYAI